MSLHQFACYSQQSTRQNRNVEWQNGGMGNGRMAGWRDGGMAEWYFTTYVIYPAIFMVHADDNDATMTTPTTTTTPTMMTPPTPTDFKSFRCTD